MAVDRVCHRYFSVDVPAEYLAIYPLRYGTFHASNSRYEEFLHGEMERSTNVFFVIRRWTFGDSYQLQSVKDVAYIVELTLTSTSQRLRDLFPPRILSILI